MFPQWATVIYLVSYMYLYFGWLQTSFTRVVLFHRLSNYTWPQGRTPFWTCGLSPRLCFEFVFKFLLYSEIIKHYWGQSWRNKVQNCLLNIYLMKFLFKLSSSLSFVWMWKLWYWQVCQLTVSIFAAFLASFKYTKVLIWWLVSNLID